MHRNTQTLGLTAIVVLIATFTGCRSTENADDPRTAPTLVIVSEVHEANARHRSFTGIVTARVQSNLTFRVAGKVTARLVDTGQLVRRGQPLMRIDRTDYGHAVTSQLGNLDSARARYTQAAADEARYRGLVASGAVSKSTYDQFKAAADSAHALLSAAEAQLKVSQDEGDYSVLMADADGTIVDTLAEPGQFVSAGQTVMHLAHAGPREAAVNLPETLRPRLGSITAASLYGESGGRYSARLRQLSDAADPLTRTYEARYVLEGAAAQAPLGATVTIDVPAPTAEGAMSVPFGAIDDEGKGPGVWIIDRKASSVSFHQVTLARFDGESAIITAGVQLGDAVVATGGHYLHEGGVVRLSSIQAAMQ